MLIDDLLQFGGQEINRLIYFVTFIIAKAVIITAVRQMKLQMFLNAKIEYNSFSNWKFSVLII